MRLGPGAAAPAGKVHEADHALHLVALGLEGRGCRVERPARHEAVVDEHDRPVPVAVTIDKSSRPIGLAFVPHRQARVVAIAQEHARRDQREAGVPVARQLCRVEVPELFQQAAGGQLRAFGAQGDPPDVGNPGQRPPGQASEGVRAIGTQDHFLMQEPAQLVPVSALSRRPGHAPIVRRSRIPDQAAASGLLTGCLRGSAGPGWCARDCPHRGVDQRPKILASTGSRGRVDPILAAGRVGLRRDNCQFFFRDFTVTAA